MHFHTRFLCGLFSWCVPHTPGGLCANLRTVFTYFLSLCVQREMQEHLLYKQPGENSFNIFSGHKTDGEWVLSSSDNVTGGFLFLLFWHSVSLQQLSVFLN